MPSTPNGAANVYELARAAAAEGRSPAEVIRLLTQRGLSFTDAQLVVSAVPWPSASVRAMTERVEARIETNLRHLRSLDACQRAARMTPTWRARYGDEDAIAIMTEDESGTLVRGPSLALPGARRAKGV